MPSQYNRIKVEDLLSVTSPRGKTIRKSSQTRSDIFDVHCNYQGCARKFASHDALLAHQKRSHAPPTAYVCEHCHATFSTAPNRNKHVRTISYCVNSDLMMRSFGQLRYEEYVLLTFAFPNVYLFLFTGFRWEACTRRWSRSHVGIAVSLLGFGMVCRGISKWFIFNFGRLTACIVANRLKLNHIWQVTLFRCIPTSIKAWPRFADDAFLSRSDN